MPPRRLTRDLQPEEVPMLESLDRSKTDVVLIVDDVPENLSLLHDALDEAGYTVLVATLSLIHI